MSLRARVAALEGLISTGTIHFWMPNGTVRTLSAARFGRAFWDGLFGRRTPDVQVIVDSVNDDATEQGHGHMVDVVRVIFAAKQSAAHGAVPVGQHPLDECEKLDEESGCSEIIQ